MTDYEIICDVLTDVFFTGVGMGKYDTVAVAPDGQASITIPAKAMELLDRLDFSMMNGDIVLDHQEGETG